MKKTTLVLNFCLLFTLFSFGQTITKDVDITLGDEEKTSRRMTLSNIVAYDETGIYAIKTKLRSILSPSSKIILEHYDKEMNPSKSVEIELEDENRERDYEFIIYLNNEMFLFSSYNDKRADTKTLFVQGVDKRTLQAKPEISQIAETDYSWASRFRAGNFGHKVSNDSSKVLIYYTLPYEKDESQKFALHVFDQDLNSLWQKNVDLPYGEDLFDVKENEVDNNGNVHLLGQLFKQERKVKRRGEPNYHYRILSYSNNGEDLKEYPVIINGKCITDMQIAINDDQDIICGGFYSSKGTTSIDGSYFLKINGETKEIMSKEFQKFSLDFITQNMSDKQKRKTKKRARKGKDVELYEYDLDRIILRADGGALLIGEQFYIRTISTTSTNSNGGITTSTTYHYYFNDIIVINMAPSGKIEWTEKIAKRQVTSNDRGFYSSYALAVVKDKLYFVFNDHIKNLGYKGTGGLYNFTKSKRKSIVVLVSLDLEGYQTREALFSVKANKILTRPKVCQQISQNEMVIFGQRKKKNRFSKITFK